MWHVVLFWGGLSPGLQAAIVTVSSHARREERERERGREKGRGWGGRRRGEKERRRRRRRGRKERRGRRGREKESQPPARLVLPQESLVARPPSSGIRVAFPPWVPVTGPTPPILRGLGGSEWLLHHQLHSRCVAVLWPGSRPAASVRILGPWGQDLKPLQVKPGQLSTS